MKWVELCLRNRLLIYIASIFLCVLGVVCMIRMPLAPFPSMQFSDIMISVSYPGANAQTVDRQVTSKIIPGLQTINNIQLMTALSQAGSSNIDLSLNSNDPDDLLQTQLQVIQAIASSNLPSVVPQPQVTVQKGWSTLVDYVLFSNKTSLFDLENLLQGVIVPGLNGMPQVSIQNSSADPVVKINLNPMKMAEYHLNASEISQLINATYQSNPLGSLDVQNQPYILNLQNNLTTIPELGNMVVGYRFNNSQDIKTPLLGSPVYLKDIATIDFEPRDKIQNNYSSVNGQHSANVQLYTLEDANPFQVSQKAAAFFAHLNLPKDIHVIKDFDMSKIIGESIGEVIFTILISSALVILIGLIFLGRFKSVLMPIVTIPICLSGAFVLLYLAGYTINFISLLAMVIAVGLVVDDAIVVVENITRYLEHGMTKREAVVQGTRDIAMTIIGITSTLLMVYLPVLFSSNPVADMFKPFTLTLMGAVFISGVLALTLTPLMSQSLLSDAPLNRYQLNFDARLERVIQGYHRGLSCILRFKKTALVAIIALILICAYVALQLPKTVFPNDPDGTVIIVAPGTPQDTVDTLRQKMALFKPFEHDKRVQLYGLTIQADPNTKMLTAKIHLDLYAGDLKQVYPLVNEINTFIQSRHLSDVYAKAEDFSTWFSGYDFSFYVYGNDLSILNYTAAQLTQKMKSSNLFSLATNEIMQPEKQLVFDINESKAASLGIMRQSISQLLSVYYGGSVLNNYFDIAGLSVPIVIQLNAKDLSNPQSFEKLMIQSPITQEYYPLDEFVTLKTTAKPLMVVSFNGQPAVKVDANLAPGHDVGQAIQQINQWMQEDFPTTQYQYVGNALQYQQSNNQALVIAGIGVLCVYFLLVVLFRNLADPLIILLTVPFSVLGGMLSLYLIHGSINLYSALGLITLVGLITKHGILIVRFANTGLKQGLSATEAVLRATHHRFRPIMMTTFAMVFGALPLIFSSNVTYMARKSLGVTLVGGLLIGTFFSLIVVPLVYVLVKKAEGVE